MSINLLTVNILIFTYPPVLLYFINHAHNVAAIEGHRFALQEKIKRTLCRLQWQNPMLYSLSHSGASLDFGVFICMNCAGAHRALGSSTTRVRSTKLDTWNRDWLDNMKIGNSVLNEYWESQLVGISKAAYFLADVANPTSIPLSTKLLSSFRISMSRENTWIPMNP